jgi:acetolactate synthase-1/2/3 large subunit
MQELATAALLDAPVCIVILDNQGWISIKAGQQNFLTRESMTDFLLKDGSVYRPSYRDIGEAFGLYSEHVTQPDRVRTAVERALGSGRPSLVAIDVARELPDAGLERTGWWDIPVPEFYEETHRQQERGRAEEQHL